ncbi:MAG: LamG-like jellyroll fold domain-containing protein, partial [Microscillaceae bacterium]|nr:LamG-like jellyroll fold domain-containing protein [Microscillaceae bacterium]
DIIALVPDGTNKDIQTFKTGIPGLTGFNNPLDLIEDTRNGNLYVSEFGANQITLLKPIQGVVSESTIKTNPAKIYTDDDVNAVVGKTHTIRVTNIGSEPLNGLNAVLNGANADQFILDLTGFATTTLNPGQSTTFKVSFNASAEGPQRANIIVSDQNNQNVNQISLNGLGEAAGKEPSLQWIVDTFVGSELINVGDDDPSTDNMNSINPTAPLLGDEITASLFRKVESDQPVSVQVIGVYSPNYQNPITELGWYESNNSGVRKPVLSVDNSHDRTIDVKITGNDHFDPDDRVFGFYTRWPVFNNRLIYTQDQLNTFDPNTNHHTRVYAVPGQPNTYIIAYEEYVGAYDYQDIVFIVRNVKPVIGGVISLENMTKIPGTKIGFPDDDYYAFSRVGAPSVGMKFHDENTVRIHNQGLAPLTINNITISNLSLFTLPNNEVFPITIGANQFYDLRVKYIDNTGIRGVKNATLEITSTAENKSQIQATLGGGFTAAPEGGNELGPQMTIDIFGFETDTRTSTIQGLPNSAYPLPTEVASGIHGDIIVSEYFVQANPAEPVVHFRLGDYGGRSPYTSQLINANWNVVSGVSFSQSVDWYNTILSRSGNSPTTPIAGVAAPTINEPFRIQLADYTTSGSNGLNPATGFPRDLGVRVYPLKDRNGKVKPYQYIVIQDFIEGGCLGTDGEASCDWDDIIDVIVNVKPAISPAAVPIVNFSVDPGNSFNYNMAQHFNPGYSGNEFTYHVTLTNADILPTWFNFNPATGEISGNAPNTPNVIVELKVIGTDLNGIQVESLLRLKVGIIETVGDCFIEVGGEVSIEAENFTRKTDALGLSWTTLISNEASAGLAMKVDNLSEANTLSATTGPQLEYDINFTTTGTYNIWVRTAAQNGIVTNNSAHLGLNGNCLTCSNGTGVGVNTATFDWTNDIDGGGTQNITLQINTPGKYTFNIWMREDGVRVDKIILTKQNGTPNAFGSNESAKGDCNTVSNPPPSGACFTEANGEVSIEAENFSRKSDALGYSWLNLASNDASGGLAMKTDNLNETNTLLTTTGPQLEYDINFTTTGTYNVWVRTAAQDGITTNNSAHLGLNGTCFTCANGTGVGVNTSAFGWTNDIDAGSQDLTIQINTPGKYTFNVWMREDGVRVDKIILTKQTSTPSGFGATQSTKGDCGNNTSPLVVLSHWKMDNNAQDFIGSNHGMTQNGATFTTTAKVGTHALNLDGVGNFVQVPNSASLNVNANFSFSLWINPQANSGRRGIITKLTNISHKQYALSMDNGILKVDYEKDANDFTATGTAIPLNQWSLIVFTVDAFGKIDVYVNGASVISTTAPALTNLSDQPLEFGRWGGSYNDSYFGGSMDDIKFYNRALTAAEVASLNAAGRPSVKVAGIESQASQEELQINLYPNPVNRDGKMNIQLTAPQGENVGIKIFNAQGMAVLNGFEVNMGRETKEISLKVSNLKPGIYFVVANQAGKTLYKRFIVTQE